MGGGLWGDAPAPPPPPPQETLSCESQHRQWHVDGGGAGRGQKFPQQLSISGGWGGWGGSNNPLPPLGPPPPPKSVSGPSANQKTFSGAFDASQFRPKHFVSASPPPHNSPLFEGAAPEDPPWTTIKAVISRSGTRGGHGRPPPPPSHPPATRFPGRRHNVRPRDAGVRVIRGRRQRRALCPGAPPPPPPPQSTSLLAPPLVHDKRRRAGRGEHRSLQRHLKQLQPPQNRRPCTVWGCHCQSGAPVLRRARSGRAGGAGPPALHETHHRLSAMLRYRALHQGSLRERKKCS